MQLFKKKHNVWFHNWLVYRINDIATKKAITQYASGILLDIGCGEKPYSTMTNSLVSLHLGLDHPQSFHNKSQVDIFATAYKTALSDQSVDTILCTYVIEHLERPQDTILEMFGIECIGLPGPT